MFDETTKLTQLKNIFNLPETDTNTVSDLCFYGLRKLFPEYDWKMNSHYSTGDTHIIIYCNDKKLYDGILNKNFRENLMTFTENFIILEKLEIATR